MILTVTLSPTVDEEYVLPSFNVGGLTSAVSSKRTAGGSGVNMALYLEQLGHATATTGFLGGFNGDYLREQLRLKKVTTNFIPIVDETRTVVHLVNLAEEVETCIYEGHPKVTEQNLILFDENYRRMLRRCSMVVLGGDLPDGVCDNFYVHLIEQAKEAGLPVFLNTEGAAQKFGLDALPFYANLTHRHLRGQGAEGTKKGAYEQVLSQKKRGIQWAVASCDQGEVFGCPKGIFLAKVRGEQPVKSLFTFDDAVTAGVVAALNENKTDLEVIAFAMACGLEDSLHSTKGLESREQVERALSFVEVEPLGEQ